jgi:predicted RNase H-like nuclease (RuvC/YqgF family)
LTCRVKELEEQVTTLEKEAEQLQRLLEAQKQRTADVEARLKTKSEESDKMLFAAVSIRVWHPSKRALITSPDE